jgi:hypothetical protein
MRYCRVLLGQFLGAGDLHDWVAADPHAKPKHFEQQNTKIDEKTRQGLKALGYAN